MKGNDEINKNQKRVLDYDQILNEVGEMGIFQWLLCLLICLPVALAGVAVFSYSLIAFTPDHRCVGCHVDDDDFGNLVYNNSLGNDMGVFDSCHKYRAKDDECEPSSFSDELVECTEFVFDQSLFRSTATEDFRMICSKAWRKSLAMSLHMVGMLIGSFLFGTMADHYGRRPALMLSSAIMAFGTSGVTFLAPGAKNYVFFAISRFLVGASQGGCVVAYFSIVVEAVGKEWRVFVAIFSGVPFAIGGLLIGATAWAGIRSWRPLLLVFSVPSLLAIVVAAIIPESPRWLLAKGKLPQLRRDVKRVCKWNGSSYPKHLLEGDHVVVKGCEQGHHSEESFIDMLRPASMLIRTLVVFYNWLVCTLCYYGLTLSASSLSSNFFMSYMLVILVEIPSYFVCYKALDLMGRKTLLSLSQILAGLFCIAASLLEHAPFLQMSFSISGKFFATIAFAMVFLMTAELYPTDIRSTATGSSSMCARIGGILAPQVASLGQIWTPLPLFVMGGSAFLGGLLVIPIIPETKGRPLPETIEEALNIGKDSGKEVNLNGRKEGGAKV